MTTLNIGLFQHFVSVSYLTGSGWREDHGTEKVTIFSRSHIDDRYEILCRDNSTGEIIAESSWDNANNVRSDRAGYQQFGDRLQDAIGERLGY